jgi:hypothetical protein
MNDCVVTLRKRDGSVSEFPIGVCADSPMHLLRSEIVHAAEEISDEEFLFSSEVVIDSVDVETNRVSASLFTVGNKDEFESHLKRTQDKDGYAQFDTLCPQTIAALTRIYGEPKIVEPQTRMLQRGPWRDPYKLAFEKEYNLKAVNVSIRFRTEPTT